MPNNPEQTTQSDTAELMIAAYRNAPRRPRKADADLALSAIKSEASRLRRYAASNEISEHQSLVKLALQQTKNADRLEKVARWLEMWGLP